MGTLRAFLRDRGRLAVLLLALVLAAKALVPAGYMVGGEAGSGVRVLTVKICADALGTQFTRQIVIPQQGGEHGKGDAGHGDAGHKTDGACAWSGLGMASLAGADPALLAIAFAFILALGFARLAPPRLERRAFLRPPLRGPPALI
jgi:hypothetical protein